MIDQPSSGRSPGEDNSASLLRTLYRGRFTIFMTMIAVIGLMIAYLSVANYKYSAELSVVSVPKQGGSLSSLPGLSLVEGLGMNLGFGDRGDFVLLTDYVESLKTAELLSRDPEIMHTIFQSEWDEETGDWKQPESAVRDLIADIRSTLGLPQREWRAPDALRLRQYIRNNIAVKTGEKPKLAVFWFTHEDPAFAAKFVTAVHAAVDSSYAESERMKMRRYVDYLRDELEKVTSVENRQAFSALLVNYEQKLMISEVSRYMLAEPMDDVIVSPRPVSPSPALMLILATMAGFMFGFMLVVMRSFFRSKSWQRIKHGPSEDD
ncbi:hypothetical protein [Tistrella mobilis]